MNVIARLGFELAYYEVTVQHITSFSTESLSATDLLPKQNECINKTFNYYLRFKTNTLEKGKNPAIIPAVDGIISLQLFYKDGFVTVIDLLLIKKTSLKLKISSKEANFKYKAPNIIAKPKSTKVIVDIFFDTIQNFIANFGICTKNIIQLQRICLFEIDYFFLFTADFDVGEEMYSCCKCDAVNSHEN